MVMVILQDRKLDRVILQDRVMLILDIVDNRHRNQKIRNISVGWRIRVILMNTRVILRIRVILRRKVSILTGKKVKLHINNGLIFSFF